MRSGGGRSSKSGVASTSRTRAARAAARRSARRRRRDRPTAQRRSSRSRSRRRMPVDRHGRPGQDAVDGASSSDLGHEAGVRHDRDRTIGADGSSPSVGAGGRAQTRAPAVEPDLDGLDPPAEDRGERSRWPGRCRPRRRPGRARSAVEEAAKRIVSSARRRPAARRRATGRRYRGVEPLGDRRARRAVGPRQGGHAAAPATTMSPRAGARPARRRARPRVAEPLRARRRPADRRCPARIVAVTPVEGEPACSSSGSSRSRLARPARQPARRGGARRGGRASPRSRPGRRRRAAVCSGPRAWAMPSTGAEGGRADRPGRGPASGRRATRSRQPIDG